MNKKMLSILCTLAFVAFAVPALAGGYDGYASNDPSLTIDDSFNKDIDVTKTVEVSKTVEVTKTETEVKVDDSFNDKTVTVTKDSNDNNSSNDSFNKNVTVTKNDNDTKTVTVNKSDDSTKTVTVTENYRKSESKIENSYNTANVQDESINIEAALVQSAALTVADGGSFQSAFGDDLVVENSIDLDDSLNGWSGVSNNAQSAGSFNNNGIMNVIAVGRDLIP